MNIFLNEYFRFCFELNFELNRFWAKFNEKMNFQNVSNRASAGANSDTYAEEVRTEIQKRRRRKPSCNMQNNSITVLHILPHYLDSIRSTVHLFSSSLLIISTHFHCYLVRLLCRQYLSCRGAGLASLTCWAH